MFLLWIPTLVLINAIPVSFGAENPFRAATAYTGDLGYATDFIKGFGHVKSRALGDTIWKTGDWIAAPALLDYGTLYLTVSSSLHIGKILPSGASLISDNGECVLDMKPNGFLTITASNNTVVWTCCPYSFGGELRSVDDGGHLTFQGDGNLVLYGPSNNNWYWASQTWNSNEHYYGGVLLAIQNDCELRLYNDKCATVWREPGDFRDPTGAPSSYPFRLLKGETLNVDERLAVSDSCYLVMRQNGSLQHIKGDRVVFDSAKVCGGAVANTVLKFRNSGSLLIHGRTSKISFNCKLWSGSSDAAMLVIEDDCKVFVFDNRCNEITELFPNSD